MQRTRGSTCSLDSQTMEEPTNRKWLSSIRTILRQKFLVMKYIDADRLRKEVRRLEKAAHKSALGCADSETRRFHEGKDFAYQYVGAIIASLQQERPEVDLEEEIMRYTRNDYDRDTTVRDVARHFYKLGLNARKED